jgi:hypothetical protein
VAGKEEGIAAENGDNGSVRTEDSSVGRRQVGVSGAVRYGAMRCDAMREVMWVRELHGRVSQTFEVVVESWGWNKISRGKTVLLT